MRRTLRVVAATVVGAATFLAVPAGPALAADVGEFEFGYFYPEGNGRSVVDSTASGGAVAEMWGATSNDLWVDNGAPVSAYRIRARQGACGSAAAQMTVTVDGVTVSGITVSATTWTDITVTGTWPVGGRVVHVALTNQYSGGSPACRRTLFLDSVTAVPAATQAATTYYVDAVAGDDGNTGTSPTAALRSADEVNDRPLRPGDSVLFKQGQRFDGVQLLADVERVVYGSYGSGTRPVLDGGGSGGSLRHTIDVVAPFVTVQDVQVQNGGDFDKVGIAVSAADVLVRRVTATGNAIGVQAQQGGDRLRVTGSILSRNTTVIEPLPETGDNDYGACGVSVKDADHVEIDHNTFEGNVGESGDFGLDGSAVEIYGATFTSVHHNRATDNHTFTELGDEGTSDTTYQNNLILTTTAAGQSWYGFNIQGTDGRFGGVQRTTITNNTIVMRSGDARPLSVGPETNAVFHNNIVQAINAGWTDGPIDEGHNVYYGNNYNGVNSSAAPGGVGIAASSKTANPLLTSDYHLPAGSPALNINTDAYGATLDLDDLPRRVGTRVDAGAYERQTA